MNHKAPPTATCPMMRRQAQKHLCVCVYVYLYTYNKFMYIYIHIYIYVYMCAYIYRTLVCVHTVFECAPSPARASLHRASKSQHCGYFGLPFSGVVHALGPALLGRVLALFGLSRAPSIQAPCVPEGILQHMRSKCQTISRSVHMHTYISIYAYVH